MSWWAPVKCPSSQTTVRQPYSATKGHLVGWEPHYLAPSHGEALQACSLPRRPKEGMVEAEWGEGDGPRQCLKEGTAGQPLVPSFSPIFS